MKKAYSSKRKYLFFLGLLSVCLIFFNTACGLDEIDVILDDPFSVEDIPNIGSQYDTRHFSFSTKKLDDDKINNLCKGYIYYKIYNNSSTMQSETGNIESMINDSARRYYSATTLIENYSYKELNCAGSYSNISQADVFSLDNKSQDIRIRLTNQNDTTDEFSARISVDGNVKGIPVRLNNKTFDFGRTGSYDSEPKKEDDDTRGFSETTTESKNYYVVLYGVFSMPAESFEKIIYSPVHYLGAVTINAADLNN